MERKYYENKLVPTNVNLKLKIMPKGSLEVLKAQF